ncbi:TetR/AcrR family transcriptional regulator [Nocardia sp. CA-107356]|uniref:TetR/AcrR family transcriptional regulator n=1 Tax=Nocardia sp. CA-107356 TaxID=3239972 RepID=UPI003D8A6CA6
MATGNDTLQPDGRRQDRATRRRAQTRARLLDAGRAVIARKGVDAATIGEIAETADLGFGSFYNYFSTKEELLDAVIDDALERHGQAMDALTSELSDPAGIVAAALHGTLAATADDPVWGWLLVRVAVSHESLLKRLGARLLSDVRRGINDDRFRVLTPALAEYMIGGALIGCMRARLDGELDRSVDAEFVAYSLRLLGIPPSEATELASRSSGDTGQR